MQEDQVVVVGSERLRQVRDLDFRRSMKFAREHLRVIERAQESFCRAASGRLSAELRAEVTIDLEGSDQLPYSAVMGEEMPQQSLVMILGVQPLQTQMAMVIDNPTALSLVARSLGGPLEDVEERETLTDLEVAIAQKAMSGAVEALSETWNELCGLTLAVVETDSPPSAVQIASTSEPTLMLVFSMRMDEQESSFALIIPWSAIEPVIEQIARSYENPEVAGDVTLRAVGRANVELKAEAGHKHMAVAELLSIQPGQTINFPQQEEDGVTIILDQQPLYRARHGAHHDRRAIQIQSSVAEEK